VFPLIGDGVLTRVMELKAGLPLLLMDALRGQKRFMVIFSWHDVEIVLRFLLSVSFIVACEIFAGGMDG
jgi:hypothetical protein